jgi:2-polyprenyl-3-methyl-5-hydroxy-6-metoxy-1,4-benzoquinol methylase
MTRILEPTLWITPAGGQARVVTSYVQGHHESVVRSHRWRNAQNSAGYLLPHLHHGMAVPDVGCGPGTITEDLARLVGPSGSVLGVDSSADVVGHARRASACANARYEVQNAARLDSPDSAFDVVHAHQLLQHVSDPVAVLREMRRVARPGGLVAARDADYAAMTWHPPSPGLDRWLGTHRAVARAAGAEPDAGRRLRSWALEAGFGDVVSSASAWCFASAEDRAWWGGMQADRVARSRVGQEAVLAGLAGEEELVAMAKAWTDWAASPDGWFAVLHGEVLCRVPNGEA